MSEVRAPGDNAVVVLVDKTEGRSELRIAPLDGSPVRLMESLTLPEMDSDDANVTGFDWSSDGRRAAFVVWDEAPHTFIIENPLAAAAPPGPATDRSLR